MTLRVLVSAFVAIVSWGATAHAQDGRIDDVSSGLVSFTVSADDLAAAPSCPGCTYVMPDPGPAIVFEVRRQNPNRVYTIVALHAGWNPATALRLEARYTVTNVNGTTLFLETPWLSIGEAPTQVFTQADVQRENRVRVSVTYRLALTGDEAAGEVTTRVTHRVLENGDAVSHDVRVSLPTTLTLRLVGTMATATAFTVAFDYENDAATYLAAVSGGTPLAATASDLVRAEVSTNHPRGYTVTVTVEEALAPDGGPDVRHRVLLLGAPAHGRTFSSTGPTVGFVPLFLGEDYALAVSGDEPPGSYLLTVRLEAVRNP